MRIHRLRVEQVRGIPAAEVCFATDGVTIVEAPNETGKTTLFDAFDLLLREKHSTSKQAVKDLQPAGRDVASLVEAELTVGEVHLTVRKRFNRERATELEVHAPVPRQLTGNEAHDELRRILAAGTDLALFEALRFEQGRSLESLVLGESEHLARRLDATAGGSGATGDDALYDRIVTTFGRYFTPTGQEGRALKESAAALDDATAEVAALAATMNELQSAAVRSDALRSEQGRIERSLEELRPQLDAHRARVQEVVALRSEVSAADAAHRSAELDLERSATRADDRRRRAEAVEELEGRLQTREAAASAATDRWRDPQHRLEELAVRLASLEADEVAARAELRSARAVDDLHRRRSELAEAEARHRRITHVMESASRAEAFLAEHPVTEEQFEAIRGAADRLRLAELRLGDAAPTVRLAAHAGLTVQIDGVATPMSAGDRLERSAPERLTVEVAGLIGLEVDPGASLAERHSERDDARQALAAVCNVLGVADPAAAEELERERARHLRTLLDRDEAIERELGEGTVEACADEVRRLTAQVAELEARLGIGAEGQASIAEEVRGRLPALEAQEQAALTATAEARAAHRALAGEVGRLRDAATRAAAELAADREELARQLADLEAARSEVSDEDLQAALAAAASTRASAEQRLTALQAALEELEPEEVEHQAENAARSEERLRTQLAAVREEQAGVAALLEIRGGQGVGEALQAAEGELARCQEAHRGLLARAAAARCLKEAFETARTAAYAAYREPLRERIVQAGRRVFGADLDVELDERLAVVGRTLGSVTLPFDRLSAGAREQLAILTALAAADLAGEDGVPLVLDDTLGYSDPGRLARLGAVLGRVRGPQVIVLTCVGARYDAVGPASVVRLADAIGHG